MAHGTLSPPAPTPPAQPVEAKPQHTELEVVTRSTWEPLDETPASAHLELRTDRALGGITEDVRALLDRRLGS